MTDDELLKLHDDVVGELIEAGAKGTIRIILDHHALGERMHAAMRKKYTAFGDVPTDIRRTIENGQDIGIFKFRDTELVWLWNSGPTGDGELTTLALPQKEK